VFLITAHTQGRLYNMIDPEKKSGAPKYLNEITVHRRFNNTVHVFILSTELNFPAALKKNTHGVSHF